MIRFVCIIAAGCLLLSACEKKETAPPPTAKPGETAGAPPAGQQTPAPAPATTPPAGGEAPQGTLPPQVQQLPGIKEVQYSIDMAAGERVNQEVCATCHAEGIAGAPKTGDKEAWKPRIAKGMPTLIENSIKGYQGNQGVMPPKGGAQSLSDAEVASAAVFMAAQSFEPAPAQ